jgi:hypothetical protein
MKYFAGFENLWQVKGLRREKQVLGEKKIS